VYRTRPSVDPFGRVLFGVRSQPKVILTRFAPMPDYERIRALASRLLALASKSREEGRHEFADELARLSAEAYDQALAMEKRERAISPGGLTETHLDIKR
jgi:hypothetical protein